MREALADAPDCRAEVLLAWLLKEVGSEGYTRDCLLMAAGFIGESEQADALGARCRRRRHVDSLTMRQRNVYLLET